MTATLFLTDALTELATALPGQVTVPGDPSWDVERLGFNVGVDQQPVAVVYAQDAEDVVTVVRFALANKMTVAAQPSGHAPTTAVNGTILLRTRALQDILVDPDRRIARVGAGVKWGEVLSVAAQHGLAGLAGSNGDPSVVGFTVSGGFSWFGRSHGLAAHNVHALELVDATGELRRVTAESDPDLFWAIRGGGGDFGIVTAIEVELFPAPQVYGGRMMWPIEMAWPVLSAFSKITETAPDELTVWAHLLRFPPVDLVPEPVRGRAFVTVDATYVGDPATAKALLAPLDEIPAMFMNSMAEMSVADLSNICDEPTTPMPVLESSGFLRAFDTKAVGALLDACGPKSESALVTVQIRHLGGAFARATADDGPNGAIEEPYLLFMLGVPMVPELVPAIHGSIAAVRGAMADYLTGRTAYTFLNPEQGAGDALPADAIARLRRIKADRDPAGVLRGNRPV